MAAKRPEPTLLIRMYGKGILPESVPVRQMAEVMSSVQTLATGTCDTKSALHLLGVKRSSAGYQCVADQPNVAIHNIALSGKATKQPSELQFYMIGAFEGLSSVAQRLDCKIQISTVGGKSLLEVESNTFESIKKNTLINDVACFSGTLIRIGGATENRCAIRLDDGKLLYCSVANRQLSRELGPHLYEEVSLTGTGLFFTKTWDVLKFEVTHVSIRKKRNFESFFRDVRAAGGDGWDNVSDIDGELEAMR